jgi:hypothetical protein
LLQLLTGFSEGFMTVYDEHDAPGRRARHLADKLDGFFRGGRQAVDEVSPAEPVHTEALGYLKEVNAGFPRGAGRTS